MKRTNRMARFVLAAWAASWTAPAGAQPAPPGVLGNLPGVGTPAPLPAPPRPKNIQIAPADAGRAPAALDAAAQVDPTPASEPGPRSGTHEEDQEPTTARQESGISLEWIGPTVSKVGQPGDYTLVVRNLSAGPLRQVRIHAQLPAGLSLQGAMPQARHENGLLEWDLGTVPGRQTHNLRLKLRADSKGDAGPRAWATCRTGTAAMRLSVREPKLALKCSAAERVLVGDPAAITVTVTNPGDGSADHVRVRTTLSAGLEAAAGNKTEFDVGTLAPGESRNVTLLCGTRTAGAQKCEATAEADGGLTTQATAALTVVMPRLELQVAGPRLRYLDRRGIYSVRVSNPGDAPALNVTVTDVVPAGLKVVAASDGGGYDFQSRTVSWFLGGLAPGQTREVQLEVQAVTVGEYKQHAAAAAGNLRAEGEATTRVEAVSALLVEVADTEDPVEVGGETAYEVRVTNTGSKTETDVRLLAVVPEGMEFKGATGPGGPAKCRAEGGTLIFEPIGKLAPQAVATFRLEVKAASAGTRRFRAEVTSTNLTEPVVRIESTRIYADAPEGTAPVRPLEKTFAPRPVPAEVPAEHRSPAPPVDVPAQRRAPAPMPAGLPDIKSSGLLVPAVPPPPFAR